ncbi:MAG: TonB-dependent receptor [Armatimonadia bacterium]
MTGVVKVQRAGKGPWVQVSRCPLASGDHVQTFQKAQATILIDGARVKLGPRTHVVIPAAKPQAAARGLTRLWAIAGKVYVWLLGAPRLEIGTEGAIAAASGTKFLVEVGSDGVTTVTVLEGTVRFYNDLGSVAVGANQQSHAAADMAPTRPMRVDPSGYLQWEASLDNVGLGWEMRHAPSATAAQVDATLTQARQAAQANPGDLRAQLALGDALEDAGDWSAAEAVYTALAQATPAVPRAQTRLGYNLLLQGRTAEAAGAFQAAAALAPTDALPVIGAALAQVSSLQEDSLKQAAALAARGVSMAPTESLAQIAAGLVAVRSGDAQKAEAAFERAVALSAQAYQAHAYLSGVQLAEGKKEAALASARRAVELAPASGLANEALATAEFYAGDLSRARQASEVALQASPNSAAAHLVASDIRNAQGDLESGLREAQLAVTLDPEFGAAWSALGMSYLAANDLAGAQKSFSHAVALSPNLVSARTGLGVTYARQGKLAAAVEEQKAAIALDASRAATHNNLGAALLSQGDLSGAAREFGAAIEAQPDWALPHANLAMLQLDLNQYPEAVREAELAVRLGDDSARLHTTLARVYLRQNRTERAWAELRRAVELDRDYALAHLELAEVYGRLGQGRNALYEQFAALTKQPAAMVEGREYSRTEVDAAFGSFQGKVKKDGRGDNGQNSYFMALQHENDDWDRLQSDWNHTTFLGIAGRQTSAGKADVAYLSVDHEDRDKPGRLLSTGEPETPGYESAFGGYDFRYLGRRSLSSRSDLTFKLGYRDDSENDYNPQSLLTNTDPVRGIRLSSEGPMAELRFDRQGSGANSLVAGAAYYGEKRGVSGVLGKIDPTSTIDWQDYRDEVNRDSATFYLERELTLDHKTRAMVGGRVAVAEEASPVWRAKAWVRRDLGGGQTLVLLTRPLLRDDAAELAPVDLWSARELESPLDLADGGYEQSYELQYQLMPRNGALLQLTGFYRSLNNYLVDLEDPQWSPARASSFLSKGSLYGAEVEWESWLSRSLSAGIWGRLSNSENDEIEGCEVPYIPRLAGKARLDYLGRSGLRVGLTWNHTGQRYADRDNTVRLGSYGLLNLRAEKQFDPRNMLFVDVENLTDKQYEYWQGYPGRPRRVRVGFEMRF